MTVELPILGATSLPVLAAAVVGTALLAWTLAAAAVAWIKRLLVRLAFRHVAFGAVTAAAGAFADRVLSFGLVRTVETLLELVGLV